MKDENKDFQQTSNRRIAPGRFRVLSLKITDRLIIKKKQIDYSEFLYMILICLFSRSMA